MPILCTTSGIDCMQKDIGWIHSYVDCFNIDIASY